MATNIATTPPATFKADAARKEKVDTGTLIPIEQCDLRVCAAWANDIDEKLEQVNEVFQGTQTILDLVVGDGTTAPVVALQKGAGDTATIEFRDITVLRASLVLSSTEGFELKRYNSSGVFQTNWAEYDASGGVTFPDNVGVTIGDGTANGIISLDKGDVNQAVAQFRDVGIQRAAVSLTGSDHFEIQRYDALGAFQANWVKFFNSGFTSFDDPAGARVLLGPFSVTAGDLDVTAGDLTVTAGNVHMAGTTATFRPPPMTTTQRDALTPVAGDVIYNVTVNKHQGYNGTIWNDFY